MLAEVQCGCPEWFGLMHPHSLLDTKGVLLALGRRESTKVLCANPLHWELICSNIFEKPDITHERAIKQEIDLLPDSVRPTKI